MQKLANLLPKRYSVLVDANSLRGFRCESWVGATAQLFLFSSSVSPLSGAKMCVSGRNPILDSEALRLEAFAVTAQHTACRRLFVVFDAIEATKA